MICLFIIFVFLFFKQKTAYEMRISDWSSDVCSSDLPQIMGQLPVLPKHYWTGKDAKGQPRDITQTTLDMPIGSGPYRIAKVDAGRSITYARVKEYWAKDLPVKIGTNNFDRVRFDYYGDPTIAFEARKSTRLNSSH